MGIDIFVLDYLLDLGGRDLGDALCLGRQGLHVTAEQAKPILSVRWAGQDFAELAQGDGYAETLLRKLGARSVQSLDFSNFEAAEIVHDLNTLVPEHLVERFDFILDGGTLEHVFDLPMAFANVKAMLKVGGVLVCVDAANNQLGHGLYQFSPELFWRVFSQDAGFEIEDLSLVPAWGPMERIKQTDPGGIRQEIGVTPSPVYLMMRARKIRSTGDSGVYQSDYVRAWART
jgi:hypothetical protein